MIFRTLICLIPLWLVASGWVTAQGKFFFDRYHEPHQVAEMLGELAGRFPNLAVVRDIGKSAGGTTLFLLELADRSQNFPPPDARPAILVSANLEGNHLLGTEAALMLAERLLVDRTVDPQLKELLERRTVYVAPLLNPDAAAAFFATPKHERTSNNGPCDEDVDSAIDEDGPEDLNGDGLITMMRVKDPEGEWIADPTEPRLMRMADPQKGEAGIFKVYLEGIDNDGDESYNEDPVGGVDPARNFPHDFEINHVSSGRWPVSEPEAQALVDFMLGHPNIALVLNFSSENTFLNLEQTGRARASGDKVKVPERFAGMLGLDPEQEYDLKEVTERVRSSGVFGPDVTEDRVAQFLGAGPAIAIDRQDLPIFQEVQKEFKEALRAANLDYPEKKARGVGKGSFTAYCYFQYGVPVFSSDLWMVPETKQENASEEPERPTDSRAAPSASSEHPDVDALKWSDTQLEGKGFVPWSPFGHPTLGSVEIGGFVPYAKSLPPAAHIRATVAPQVDFYLRLMDKIAELQIQETRVKRLDDSVYAVTCYLSNPGSFPTSTAQGRRAQTSWPITVRIITSDDQFLFSGRPIESVPFLAGNGDRRKVEWTVRGKPGSVVEVSASSPKLGTISTQVTLR
jgi:murein tripeptide amidase MpaA